MTLILPPSAEQKVLRAASTAALLEELRTRGMLSELQSKQTISGLSIKSAGLDARRARGLEHAANDVGRAIIFHSDKPFIGEKIIGVPSLLRPGEEPDRELLALILVVKHPLRPDASPAPGS